MAIGEDKTRTNITFPKELKVKLEELAQKDGRSFNNLIIKILSDYVEDTQKQSVLYFTVKSPIQYACDLVHSKTNTVEIDQHTYFLPIQAIHHNTLYLIFS